MHSAFHKKYSNAIKLLFKEMHEKRNIRNVAQSITELRVKHFKQCIWIFTIIIIIIFILDPSGTAIFFSFFLGKTLHIFRKYLI